MKKILIVTGGPVEKLEKFRESAHKLGIEITTASLYDFSYNLIDGNDYRLLVQEKDVAEFGVIYIRVIGKRFEEASLLVDYAKRKNIRLVDEVYQETELLPSTILKTLEMKKLFEAGIPIPKTYHGSLQDIFENAETHLGFPFIIKSSIGQKARGVWAPKSREEVDGLYKELRVLEKQGKTFFAQELITASKRARVLVVGGKVVGGIIRSTKFRKRFQEEVGGEYPEPHKETLLKVPNEMAELSLAATKAAKLDIAGIDLLIEDNTNKLYVIEANAAPSWKLITKHTEVDVEDEIVKHLASL